MNLTPQLTQLLKQLRLSGVVDTLEVRNRQAVEQQMNYLEFLTQLAHDEVERREQKKLARRLRRAGFPSEKTLEGFNFDARPTLNRQWVLDLASCGFIEEKANVLIVGPSGVGKSHLAQALGHTACRRGYDVLFATTSRLLTHLHAGRADGSYERRLTSICRPLPTTCTSHCASLPVVPAPPPLAQGWTPPPAGLGCVLGGGARAGAARPRRTKPSPPDNEPARLPHPHYRESHFPGGRPPSGCPQRSPSEGGGSVAAVRWVLEPGCGGGPDAAVRWVPELRSGAQPQSSGGCRSPAGPAANDLHVALCVIAGRVGPTSPHSGVDPTAGLGSVPAAAPGPVPRGPGRTGGTG